MTADTVVLGPSPEATAILRAEFAASAAEWSVRAEQAGAAGDIDKATRFRAIALIAARVAGGG